MDKEEILYWSKKYDADHPWWTQKEKEIGDRLRTTQELTKNDLIEIVEWKFKELEGRRKRVLALIGENEDAKVRSISKYVFSLDSSFDAQKVDLLQALHGVGVAIASVILTFYNPNDYCVFDIHVWRELFGKEPLNLYTAENYLKVLSKLREEAKKHSLSVRTVEKAYFKKNIDEEN
ncbi:MAG: hypothetical protein QXX59_07225 [Candidatus Bathyarchaeia archaeon]